VLRFPMHVLTAAALSQAIFNTSLHRYELEEEWWRTAHVRRDRSKEWNTKAKEEAEGVILDLENVLGITNVGGHLAFRCELVDSYYLTG
jgi:hypothetical protein